MEVVSNPSNPILEQASQEDVRDLQAYTIRKMDQYMPTGKDIDHYKLLHVHEQPLDNRQKVPRCVMLPNIVSHRHVWRISSL